MGWREGRGQANAAENHHFWGHFHGQTILREMLQSVLKHNLLTRSNCFNLIYALVPSEVLQKRSLKKDDDDHGRLQHYHHSIQRKILAG